MALAPTCPNQFPARPATRRIALVLDAPGTADRALATCSAGHRFSTEWRDVHGTHKSDRCTYCGTLEWRHTPTPLAGYSGHLVEQLLQHAGISRAECFVGHVCQVTPPGGELARLRWDGPEVQGGLATLRDDLAKFAPHFVLLLGNGALRAFGGRGNVDDRRGYLFESTFLEGKLVNQGLVTLPSGIVEQLWLPLGPVKCLATYSPKRLQMEYGLTGVVKFDFRRAAAEARVDGLEVPARHIIVDATAQELLEKLTHLRVNRVATSFDIEGGCQGGISCIGFALDAHYAFVIPFTHVDGSSYWEREEDELALWEAVAAYLEDPACPKTIQNALYEIFVLAWTMGIVVRGIQDDTMLKHYELHCELDKSLEFQASIYTRQPYWKLTHRQQGGRYVPYRDGKPISSREWYLYNGTDCCVTAEIAAHLEGKLAPGQESHYRFNMSLLAPLSYMMLRGIRYDKEQAKKKLRRTERWINVLQDMLNREAARNPEKEGLRAFFKGCGLPVLYGVDQREAAKLRANLQLQQEGMATDVSQLLPLLVDAFCVSPSLRREKRQVEEVRWQPHRWNGKRWVKAGKQMHCQIAIECGAEAGTHLVSEETPEPSIKLWLKPIRRTVEKSCPVEITSLELVERFAKDSCAAECRRAIRLCRLLQRRGLGPAQRGQLATLLGISVKVTASGRGADEELEDGTVERGDERDANWFLYEHCALPKQYKKDGIRLTDKLASDEEAVIKAWLRSGKDEHSRDRRALLFLKLKKLLTATKSLRATPDPDGRIRCSYNLVGTETHRLTCYGSPTGSSKLNLQTVTKGHRVLYLADEGCWMAQRDLAGADGWTVAAYCAMLGDSNMLEDYRAKLKPAQILVLMLDRGAAVNNISRTDLKPLCAPITEETDWRYFAMKRVQHGGSYKMGKLTMADQILTDSFKKSGKPIWIDPAKCEGMLKQCLFVRYPGIPRWHDWTQRELAEKGALTASNGFRRQFHGRKGDHDTLKQALAHLPQVYTTYATTMAISRLWTDPDNRRPDGSLRCEPLHTVHDSLVTQFPKEETEWAKGKMTAWFQNEIRIAQTLLTIPASGTYGANWKEQDHSL